MKENVSYTHHLKFSSSYIQKKQVKSNILFNPIYPKYDHLSIYLTLQSC